MSVAARCYAACGQLADAAALLWLCGGCDLRNNEVGLPWPQLVAPTAPCCSDLGLLEAEARRLARAFRLDASNASLNLGRSSEASLRRISLVDNCGDFQMARRELWARGRFE